MERYNFKIVEDKWQKYWTENKDFKSNIDTNKKILLLRNVPYPSGKIHMGHVRNYTSAMFYLGTKSYQDIMYFIQWVGIHLACQQKMLQNKTT